MQGENPYACTRVDRGTIVMLKGEFFFVIVVIKPEFFDGGMLLYGISRRLLLN